jgi:uncharacterized membrane protein
MDSSLIFTILRRAFDSFIRDILPLIVAGFLVTLLSALTLGLLGGPLLAGLYRMVSRRMTEGRTPEIGDVFYFDRFLDFVLAFYALTILIAIGFMFFILPGLYLLTIWLFAFPLMVERGHRLGEAMAESKAISDRVGLAQQFATALLLALIGAALGSVTGGLGGLVFAPFSVCYVLVALREYTREVDPV